MPREVNEQAVRLGQTIRQHRKAARLTQSQLAELMGDDISQNYVSLVENGYIAVPRQDRIHRFAAALGVSSGELLAKSGWSDIGEYLEELDDRARAVERLSGPRAELARLLPELSTRDVEKLLYHAEMLLERRERQREVRRSSVIADERDLA